MTTETIDTQRRRTLAALAGIGMGGVFMSSMHSQNAFAQQGPSSDYRALVCMFCTGGLDQNDTILPFDSAAYNQMRSFRRELLGQYSNLGGDVSRDLSNLLPLLPSDQQATEGRSYALPRSLAPLHELFNEEELVFLGSVGALVEPTDRRSFSNRSVELPPSLFSHNDQQNYWQGLRPEGARVGWGGQFMDSLHERGLVGDPRFGVVSTSGRSLFGAARDLPNFSLPNSGPQRLRVESSRALLGRSSQADALRQRLSQWFRQTPADNLGVLGADFQQLRSEAIQSGDAFGDEFNAAPNFQTSFPATRYGSQMQNVAKSIRIANTFGMNRQIFFVSSGGFDTHSNQAESLPGLQSSLAGSVKAFRDAMNEIGMWDNVAVFSAADFGRTLVENGSGTDHGWGSHHFIAGGSVRGGRMLGRFPEYDPAGGEYTESRARLIPSVSIEQYSASLGEWFGVDNASLNAALPNLGNFATPTLDVFNS